MKNTSIHNLASMDSWPETPNHLQVLAWSPKIDGKKKKKKSFYCLQDTTPHFSTLGFLVGLDRMMKLILILRHKPK